MMTALAKSRQASHLSIKRTMPTRRPWTKISRSSRQNPPDRRRPLRHSNNKWNSFPSIHPPLLRQCHTHRHYPTMPSPSNWSQHTPRSHHPHQRRSQLTRLSIRQRTIKIITTMGGGDVEDETEEEDVVEDGDVERAPPTRTLPRYHRKLRHTRQCRMEQFLPHLVNQRSKHSVEHIPTLQNT